MAVSSFLWLTGSIPKRIHQLIHH